MASEKSPTVSVEEFLGTIGPEVRALVERLRRLGHAAAPGAVERAYPGWGVIRYLTSERYADRVAYLSPGRDYVNLGFDRAVDLPDPKRLLVGTGARMRHIRIQVSGPFVHEDYLAMIEAAFAEQKARGHGP